MSKILGASACVFALLAPGISVAQTVAPSESAVADSDVTDLAIGDEANAGDIVVTGSRTILDGSRAPTPVTVVSASQLEDSAPGTIAQGLNQLPAFRGSTNASSGQSSSTSANSGSFVNLRNLGAQRTLLLLDGRRAPPSTVLGTVDTNILPQELVKRVDVVTGGASAAYGSDAVAGVVNFVLDTGFEGIKGSVQAGTTTYGDNGTQKVSLTTGASFAGGRGRIVASGSYYNADGAESTFDRPYGRRNPVLVRDPANPSQTLIVNNFRSTLASAGGLVFGGGLLGMGKFQFAPGGALVPFDPGSIANSEQVGGDGVQLDFTLGAEVRYTTGFAHAEFDVTDRLTVFAEGMFGKVRNRYRQVRDFWVPAFNAPTILSGNAFLSPETQAILTANRLPGFQLARLSFDTPPATATTTNDTYNLVGGLRWKLPGDWQLDGYYQRSRNVQLTKVADDVVYSRFFAAVDAVRDPAGNIVCNVTLTNPGLYPGCVPINLFGNGSPSAAAIDYIKGTAFFRAAVKQEVLEVSVRGTAFALPAGDVRVAISADYRKDSVTQTADPLSSTPVSPTGLRLVPAAVLAGAGSYQLGNVQPLSGAFDVKELAGEINIPVLSSSSPVGSIDLNGAARYTDYSISGGVTTWKAGAVWKPVEGLALRGTVSRDIRAPNISDLFGGSIQSQVTVNDTRNNIAANVIQSRVGSTNLKPESAKTYTAGIVFSGIPGLVASLDYYNIDVSAVISTLTPQQTVDACTASGFVSPQCANLVYSNPAANTGLVRVFTLQQNLSRLRTSGLDGELGYRSPIGAGAIELRVLASYLLDYSIGVPGGALTDFAGVVGTYNNPTLTGLASASYSVNGVTFYVQERLVGRGRIQAGTEYISPAILQNDIGARWYTDATIKFDVGGKHGIQLFGTVNNLFDRAPPAIPYGSFQSGFPTNASIYDVLGRTITAGARFKF